MTLPDQQARDRIKRELGTTFVVEAAAGTGKTTALVDRIVAVIEAGHGTLDRMVALTFTEKAAGEMKLRLRARLEQQRAEHALASPGYDRLTAALRALEAASVGTIHGFCSDLLHERPVEAGVDPRFEVIAGDEEQLLLDQVMSDFLQDALEAPGDGLRRALRRNDRPGQALEGLRFAVRTLIEQRDFDGAWARPQFNRKALIDETLATLRGVSHYARMAASRTDPLAQSLNEMHQLLANLDEDERTLGFRDDDALEFSLRKLSRHASFRRKGYGRWYGKELPREVILAARQQALEQLSSALNLLEADLAARLHEELQEVVKRYETRKAESGKLDYLDLLLRTRDMLRDDTGVREAVQAHYLQVFVDEFQDIDPLQADIIAYLCGTSPDSPTGEGNASPAGKLFVVGDPKQAIYRFRRADVVLYERVKRKLLDGGAEVLQLTTSFRARPAIQSAINAAFSEHMVAQNGEHQATYQPLHAFRAEPEDESPGVVALPIAFASAHGSYLSRKTVAEKTPATVAAFIDTLLQSELMVTESDGQRVPVSARHICLLFRRFRNFGEDVTRPYVRALEAQRIAHVLVGGRSFHRREEIIAIRSALHAIEWPDDHLHVYAALRGPFVALSDESLFAYRMQVGTLHPLHRLTDEETRQLSEPLREVREALELLKALHLRRNRSPVAETIHRFLETTRAHAGVAIWPTGEQALANLMRVVDLSRHHEQRGATSFRAFVEWLAQSAEREDLGEAPVIEEGTEGVRMMTVHTAKGLEFPVVILCDPTTPRNSTSPSRYIDLSKQVWASKLCGCSPLALQQHAEAVIAQDDAEEVRVAYVAATRAKDMLVVPIVDDHPVTGWTDPLHRALYPKPGSARLPLAPPPDLPKAEHANDECALAPGFHLPERGDHRTLVWDVGTLDTERTSVGGLRQQQLLVEDPENRKTEEGLALYRTWQTRQEAAIESGLISQSIPITVTQLSHETSDVVVQAEVARVERSAERPRGKRFGTLVHAVLADANFSTDPLHLSALARFHGRLLDASASEVEHAESAARAALLHPLMETARLSPDARFEVPITQRLGDGRIVEGVIDLLFRSGAGRPTLWTVVDFKTDAEPGTVPAYSAQVALYAAAVREATGEPVCCVLLAV